MTDVAQGGEVAHVEAPPGGTTPVAKPSPRAKGIDVSSWQHPGGKAIDWHAVAQSGVTFVMIKATQGDSYTNEYLKEDIDGAHEAGLLVGAYHFYTTGVPSAEQAAFFGGALAGKTTELGCYLDWEPPEFNAYLAKTEIDAFVLEGEKYRVPIGLYTGESWLSELKPTGLEIRRLWLADWSNDALPSGVAIWQSGIGEVPGITGAVDTDWLLSVRGLNVPRPIPAAERPFVGSNPTRAEVAEVEESRSDGETQAPQEEHPPS